MAVAPRDLAAKRVHERTQPHSNDAQHANLDREFQAALEERDRLKRELDSAYSERDTYAARLATTRDDHNARPAGGTDADTNDSPVQQLEKEVHKIEHEAKRLDRFIDSKLRETGCVISATTDQQPTPTQQEKEERASVENARE
jgi:predicted RNase H-like nuclease (RuvC/YqgF family)